MRRWEPRRRLTVCAAAIATLALACTGSQAPPTTTAPSPDGTTPATSVAPSRPTDIAGIVASDERLTTLERLLERSGMGDPLHDEGPFTLFAPTDAAYGTFDEDGSSTFDEDDLQKLTEALTFLVVPVAVDADALTDGRALPTVQGDSITVRVAPDGTITLVGRTGRTATVIARDLEASNGLVHVIDGVLLPEELPGLSSG